LGLLAALAAGCQKPAQKPETPQPETSGLTTSDRRVISDKLSKQARQVEGVQNATVVLTEMGSDTVAPSPTPGETQVQGLVAMVGVTIKSGADENKVKEEIRQKLKAVDSRVSHVLVTTDPNLIRKINDVAAGLIDGKPFQTMKDDINAINQQIKKDNPKP
jgi:actin-like ATPase involved in cell morphogenesis